MKLKDIKSQKAYSISCIYLWTNLINGKKYVGQAHNFYNRMSQYKQGFFNRYMKRAIDKYGIDNFDIIILEKDIEFDKLDIREQYWLDYYKSYEQNNGYNICKIASSTYGFRHSEYSKKLMSEKIKLYHKNNPDCVLGKNNGMYGVKHNKEWRENHSNFLKEKWKNDEDYRNFWSEKMKGESNPMYNETHRKTHFKSVRRRKVRCVETGVAYKSVTEASNLTSCSRGYMSTCCDDKNKTSGGFHWEYVD